MKNSNKLFIGGLNFTTSRHELIEEFSKYGSVIDLKLPINKETGMAKGFCFLTMESKEDADSVRDNMDGVEYDGRVIGVKDYANNKRKKEHIMEI